MPTSLAERFIDCLSAVEKTRDVDSLANLFTAQAEVGNVLVPEKFYGVEGARDFWTKYRDTFDTIQSTYRNTIVSENRIALEWNSEATSVDGQTVQYSGVSILEVEGDKVSRFRAYFDSAALGRQIASAK